MLKKTLEKKKKRKLTKFCCFQDQINQKKVRIVVTILELTTFLSVLVSMAFSVLENEKEKGRFDLACTKGLFYCLQFIKRRQTL